MAHFAKLDENNIVVQLVVISNDDMLDENGNESEAIGAATCEMTAGAGNWIQTSFNSNFRKQYAGIGFSYDPTADVFILPKPYESWVLNENFDWDPPVPKPDNVNRYIWNEENLEWDDIGPENLDPLTSASE